MRGQPFPLSGIASNSGVGDIGQALEGLAEPDLGFVFLFIHQPRSALGAHGNFPHLKMFDPVFYFAGGTGYNAGWYIAHDLFYQDRGAEYKPHWRD